MGPVERREREKQEVRRKILDAARSLFAEHGYDAVTMRKIAEQIEYSPTAIYLHFKDKDELIQELCAHDFLAFSQRFASVVGIPDAFERLRAAGQAYIQFALENPNHYRLMFMTPRALEPSAEARERRGDPQRDAYAFLRELVSAAVAEGVIRGDVGSIDLVAQTIWAGVHGVISLEIAMTCSKDEWIEWAPLEERVRVMVDVLIAGLRR